MKKKYIKYETTTVKGTFTDLEFTCHYPEENPERAVEDITRMMAHLGLFDDL